VTLEAVWETLEVVRVTSEAVWETSEVVRVTSEVMWETLEAVREASQAMPNPMENMTVPMMRMTLQAESVRVKLEALQALNRVMLEPVWETSPVVVPFPMVLLAIAMMTTWLTQQFLGQKGIMEPRLAETTTRSKDADMKAQKGQETETDLCHESAKSTKWLNWIRGHQLSPFWSLYH